LRQLTRAFSRQKARLRHFPAEAEFFVVLRGLAGKVDFS